MNVKDDPAPNADEVQPNGHAPVSTEDDPAPVPDGEGGLIVPAAEEAEADEVEEQVEDRRAFPTEGEPNDVEMADEAAVGEASADQDKTPAREDVDAEEQDSGRASLLLPEIGRLAREMVRNGEEKVALAVGAYNAVC